MYYRLTSFYQIHQQYISSFDTDQLLGKAVASPGAGTVDRYEQRTLAHLSNLMSVNAVSPSTYEINTTGISWPTDKDKHGATQYSPSSVVPPPYWALRYPNGTYTDQYLPPDLSKDESFMVWMRVAALPDFRKMWGRNDAQVLEAGRWRIMIDMNFDTTLYGGTNGWSCQQPHLWVVVILTLTLHIWPLAVSASFSALYSQLSNASSPDHQGTRITYLGISQAEAYPNARSRLSKAFIRINRC
ncbi:ligand-effect modulator 3 family [Dichotomocladium elegans]|nr:ligand-effect modulator 3 family [Dichotomocladium elegans]